MNDGIEGMGSCTIFDRPGHYPGVDGPGLEVPHCP